MPSDDRPYMWRPTRVYLHKEGYPDVFGRPYVCETTVDENMQVKAQLSISENSGRKQQFSRNASMNCLD
jgi:hypothetical protein